MRNPALDRAKRRVDDALGWILVITLGLSVLTVLWQVFSRYVLANPSSFTDELVRYLLIWIGLFGAAYATGQRLHLAIDLLPSRWQGRRRVWLDLVIQGLIFLFAASVMVIGGAHLVHLTLILGQTSAALGLPLGIIYLALPISGLLILFYSSLAIIEGLHRLQQPERREH